MKNAAR